MPVVSLAVATFLQLAVEPQKHQANANVNANVSLEGEWRVDPRPNGDLTEVLAVLQELAPLIPSVGEVDGTVVDAVRPSLAGSEGADSPATSAP